uniref:VMP32 protein n=1 Tax=Bicyclus anynana TaxID=110368 RepID=A0A1C9EGK2_BICAN|nr:VMP32 protein [Bicyclus anynana]
MAHHFVVFYYILLIVHTSLANQNQFYENPGTAIIEAFPSDITNSNEDLNLEDNSTEKCAESEKYLENFTLDNNQLRIPDVVAYNQLNAPSSDPYLRASFHKGRYYPYNSYYQVDAPNDSVLRDRTVSYDNWYPYINPSVHTSLPYSNIPPVSSLPPVYARMYGNYLPIEPDWMTSQIRRQRKLFDDEDLLKQLEYDAIMKNILPTMPVPLPRDANNITPQSTGIPYVHASFPHSTSDCALPIFLGCTPKVTYGHWENQNLIPVPYAHDNGYRSLLENKVQDHVDISDEKPAKKQ